MSTDWLLKRYCKKGQYPRAMPHDEESHLERSSSLNHFLSSVEKRAFSMARFAVGNEDAALDIVQDTMFDFVRLYRSKPDGEWPPLFYRVLQSRIRDAHRRGSVLRRLQVWLGWDDRDGETVDPLQELADPNGVSPLKHLERSQLGTHLERAIGALPLRQQQAFLLRSWEGLDVADTARAMGCSEGSVKTHYFRAVQALRGKLEEYQP